MQKSEYFTLQNFTLLEILTQRIPIKKSKISLFQDAVVINVDSTRLKCHIFFSKTVISQKYPPAKISTYTVLYDYELVWYFDFEIQW